MTMQTVNNYKSKTYLPRLIEKPVHGESFIIAEAGKSTVKVVVVDVEPVKAPQRLGFMKGKMRVPDDFDTMYAKEIEDLFYNDGKL